MLYDYTGELRGHLLLTVGVNIYTGRDILYNGKTGEHGTLQELGTKMVWALL